MPQSPLKAVCAWAMLRLRCQAAESPLSLNRLSFLIRLASMGARRRVDALCIPFIQCTPHAVGRRRPDAMCAAGQGAVLRRPQPPSASSTPLWIAIPRWNRVGIMLEEMGEGRSRSTSRRTLFPSTAPNCPRRAVHTTRIWSQRGSVFVRGAQQTLERNQDGLGCGMGFEQGFVFSQSGKQLDVQQQQRSVGHPYP